MNRFHEYDSAPLAGILADMIALNQRQIALEREEIEFAIRRLEMRAHLNRTLGQISDATQQFELAARTKKAAPLVATKEAA